MKVEGSVCTLVGVQKECKNQRAKGQKKETRKAEDGRRKRKTAATEANDATGPQATTGDDTANDKQRQPKTKRQTSLFLAKRETQPLYWEYCIEPHEPRKSRERRARGRAYSKLKSPSYDRHPPFRRAWQGEGGKTLVGRT